MFIQNAVLKSINAEGLSFPLAEGSVVSVGGVTGIVPTTLGVRPATNRIYVAVAGTIDMTSDANKGVTFTDEQIKALGGDFNFVPALETPAEIPSYKPAQDSGKVLTVVPSGLSWEMPQTPAFTAYVVGFEYDSQSSAYYSDTYIDQIPYPCSLQFVFTDESDDTMKYYTSDIRYYEAGDGHLPIYEAVFSYTTGTDLSLAAHHIKLTWEDDGEGESVTVQRYYTQASPEV